MSASAPSPRPFGPYVLTHALGTDALGEVWRAGTAGAPRLKPFLLVHTFTAAAIDRSALLSAMETAVNLVDDVQGPTVARGTVMGAIDDIPFLGTLYVEGRTLDHLLAARLLGSPLPVEHGLHIAERLLTALEAGAPVERFTGAAHGFLVPAFVCISNEGEARVFGHGLGAGLLPALKNARMRQTFAPYVAPEVLAEGKPSTAGDLYSAGAILYEALTGRAPPSGVALESVERANLAVDGTPVPEDIRRLLRRALHPDPRMRDRQISTFRRDLSALLYGGRYAPSTFNLAFFLQKHFDKAIQREKLELAAEEEIDPATLAVPPVPASAPADEPLSSGPVPVRAVAGPASRKPLGGAPPWAVGGGAVLLLAAGAFFALRPTAPPPLPVPTPAPTLAPPTPVEAQQAAATSAGPAVKDGDLVETELIDTPPVPVRQVSPQATRLAIQRHVSGTIFLRVLVDENGLPARVEILRDTKPKVGLGDASIAALAQWRWKPATKDGHKVKTWIAVQVPFKN